MHVYQITYTPRPTCHFYHTNTKFVPGQGNRVKVDAQFQSFHETAENFSCFLKSLSELAITRDH